MDVVFTRCAGLDVHKKSITACRMIPDPTGHEAEGIMELKTFGTMTRDLLVLADWLTEASITHVAMESTGEYWKPVYNLLEDTFTVFLVNAAHVKNVPGRKTDKADARWLAKLMRFVCCKRVSSRPRDNETCVISPVIGRSSCKSASVR
jgi:transposase